ncbi:MAG TPA: glycogen synthase GlgA [Myxococcales bacterium]|nr:glycogen synthase GlgA [Myxococcales bacterium]
MKILFVASEAAPYVKTGGLGDVIGALPRALARRGHELLVVVPRYGVIDGAAMGLRDTGRRVEVQFPGLNAGAHVHVHVPAERLRFLFLQSPWFDRKELYGEGGKDYRDNHKRFALLCAGALEAAKQQNFIPDAVHAHDWQAALVPLILKRGWAGRPPPFRARCVFTIHNVAYQGIFPREAMQELELPGDLFNPDALEFYGNLNLMKAGLVFAEKLTTVSPTYAREIVESPDTGAGLEGLLRHRLADLVGIMNGVDYERWSPETDPMLEARYSARDLSGKAACKKDLQETLGLDVEPDTMVTAAIGRLAHQKGYDILAQALPGLVQRKVQFALLGTGDNALEEEFAALAVKHPGRVSAQLRFDDKLAHRIEAGADVFLMPSRFEPCGLNQLYSLKYGTLPLVHAVGGLNDSIAEGPQGWGFRFDHDTPADMLDAVDRALQLWKDRPAWQSAMQRAMTRDHSWDRAAEQYETLYKG